VIVVRFADDFVVGFEHREEAIRFLAELRERFARFGLSLHPDKTRLIEFGRFAAPTRRARGAGKPETFNFLGFTHACSRMRKGRFTVLRQTMRQRLQAKLRAVKTELRQRLHAPIPEQGAYLRSVVVGHTRYYGVPRNGPSLSVFHAALVRLWRVTLQRRSQTGFASWTRMRRLAARWLPGPRICHPYPNQRLACVTQGRSRMRSPARPDLWRGCPAMGIPTPTVHRNRPRGVEEPALPVGLDERPPRRRRDAEYVEELRIRSP
jgi:RNA-directed DNA polymerase